MLATLFARYRKSIKPPYVWKDYLVLFVTGILGGIIPTVFLQTVMPQQLKSLAQTPQSFTFTAVGDFGSSSTTTTVLQGINPTVSGADFHIALGDLSYASLAPESAWCNYVKSNVGETFPFELIAGNHDDDTPAGYNINGYTQCLPHLLGPITGSYGKEYYFDYPAISPLARFILISPRMIIDGVQHTFATGSTHMNWLTDAIDSARASGIKWIVVGMHVNCISMGTYGCSQVQTLYNTLTSKKVDLIVSAHDHSYQRTKQLALSTGCNSIATGRYNANCVVDDGSDNAYTKGAGPVMVISATGGKSLHTINENDSEQGYFVQWIGSNVNPTWGFFKATVTENDMSVSFVPRVGSFSDSFVITDSSSPTPMVPTHTPTPTIDPFSPTPTIQPTASPTPIPSQTPTPFPTPLPSETPVPSPGPSTLSLVPIADAYVKSANPSTNFGSLTTLQVDANGTTPSIISYLKFDLSSLAGRTIISSTLKIKVTNGSTATQTIKESTNASWTENSITYTNRPALGTAITNFNGGKAGTWKSIDMTSWISSHTGEIISFGIDQPQTNGFDFYSKENSADKPTLDVIYN